MNHVSLRNILVSHSLSAYINEQSLLSSFSTLMFGVLPGLSLPWGSGTVTFIDDYSRCVWLFLMKTRVGYSLFFRSFMLKFELNLILQFVSYEVIMPRNIFLDHYPPLCPHMRFFISPLVHTLLKRMEWLRSRTVI